MKALKRLFFMNNRIKELESQNEYLNKILKARFDLAFSKLESLEQEKIYYVVIPEPDMIEAFKDSFSVVVSNLPWTCPPILVLQRELRELNLEELKLVNEAVNNRGVKE